MIYQESFKLYTDFCKFMDDNRDDIYAVRTKFNEMFNVIIDENLHDIDHINKVEMATVLLTPATDMCTAETFELFPYGMIPVVVIKLILTKIKGWYFPQEYHPGGWEKWAKLRGWEKIYSRRLIGKQLPGWEKFMRHYIKHFPVTEDGPAVLEKARAELKTVFDNK